MKKLLIVGGKGSGEIAMSVFEDINKVKKEWSLEGYLTDILPEGELLGNYKVIGPTTAVEYYASKGYYVHYALHFNALKKEERVHKLQMLNIPLELHATGIHPLAYVNPSTEIGHGVLMLPNSATSFGPKIGNFIHIYTGAFIGHDAVISDYTTLAAQSIIGGRVLLEEGVHFGLNAVVREDLTIGKYSIIGMGAVVTKSVAAYDIVAGNPARKLRNLHDK